MFSVGVDLVSVSRVAESVATFGDRYLRRLFTDDELAYAAASAEKLAARFAAKEAVKKALGLTDGIAWRDIEVRRAPSGAPSLAVRGEPRADLALSLSHEGDYAIAVVVFVAHASAHALAKTGPSS